VDVADDKRRKTGENDDLKYPEIRYYVTRVAFRVRTAYLDDISKPKGEYGFMGHLVGLNGTADKTFIQPVTNRQRSRFERRCYYVVPPAGEAVESGQVLKYGDSFRLIDSEFRMLAKLPGQIPFTFTGYVGPCEIANIEAKQRKLRMAPSFEEEQAPKNSVVFQMRCLSRMRQTCDNGEFTGGTGYGCSVIGAAALQLDSEPGFSTVPRDTVVSEDKEDREKGLVDGAEKEDCGPIVDGDICEFVGLTNKQETDNTGGYLMHNGKGRKGMKVIIVKLADYSLENDGDDSEDDDTDEKGDAVRGAIQMSNGLVGLQNMGNTCYMNSAIQCLSNTRALTEFFCHKYHEADLNKVNLLGTRGQLAKEYATLMRNLWVSKRKTYQPRSFMKAVAKHNATFAGNRQQDSQELLSILLACLSEDLNRVLKKPYIEQPESNTEVGKEPVTEYLKAAGEWWSNHLKREYSIIEALFTGQFKSTIHFPDGTKSSTFEPFSCLQLPLPFPVKRTVPVNLCFPDGRAIVRCSIRITLASTLKEAKEGSFAISTCLLACLCSFRVRIGCWLIVVVP
jgi:hypothetical protein